MVTHLLILCMHAHMHGCNCNTTAGEVATTTVITSQIQRSGLAGHPIT